MKRIDIVTDVGVFVLEVDPFEYVVNGDEAPGEQELFDLVRRDVLTGCQFCGWTPYENTETDAPSTITIEDGASIKSLRMYDFENVGVVGFNADATPTPATPYPFTCNGEYLGNKLRITGVAFCTPSTEYLLPIFVNDKPATDYMKAAALSQQIQLCKQTEGVAPTDYLIVIPDVWLEPTAAAEYITDYVLEAEPMTELKGGGKAKAWPGWSE